MLADDCLIKEIEKKENIMKKLTSLFKSKAKIRSEAFQSSRVLISRYVQAKKIDEKIADKMYSKYIDLYNQGSQLEMKDLINTYLKNKN